MQFLLAAASSAGDGVPDRDLREEVIAIPTTASDVTLQTTIFLPPGDGPFPLLMMNHGKSQGEPHAQKRARYLVMSTEFVRRGYAVALPMRRGFAGSGGHYASGGCSIADNARMQADDLEAALEFLVRQPWVDRERIVVAGQSHGALAAMAFGMRKYAGVRGILNFAGGLRKRASCDWQDGMVRAFGEFGRRSRVPSLWFYGEIDRTFPPELAVRLVDAYRGAGGDATLIAFDPFKDDAHRVVGSRDGVAIWWPPTRVFLESIGMPTALAQPALGTRSWQEPAVRQRALP